MAVQDALKLRQHTTSELIGVLVHNVRHAASDTNFLDSPIAIDPFDQTRLASMKLIRASKRSVLPEQDVPIAELTELGSFVVERVVLLQDGAPGGLLPMIDPDQVNQLLS